jgi:hypothetical protein
MLSDESFAYLLDLAALAGWRATSDHHRVLPL